MEAEALSGCNIIPALRIVWDMNPAMCRNQNAGMMLPGTYFCRFNVQVVGCTSNQFSSP